MSGKKRLLLITLLLIGILSAFGVKTISAANEFPQRNAWYKAYPSVVWCGDPTSTTTLEVHIVDRTDVARVWLTYLGTDEDEGRGELFDDGTHGDIEAGDNIFTLSDVALPCRGGRSIEHGWNRWMGFLRVELDNGDQIGNNYGMSVGQVDKKYKDAFEITELAPGLTASAFALFIEDSQYEVMDGYPVANVYCGKSNYAAYQKLYTVLPDIFDVAMVHPGMPIYKPENFGENVPYNVLVSNQVENIGVDIMDNTAKFGSNGKLQSVIYMSFGAIAVFDHEIGHTWGPGIGQSLGLFSSIYNYDVNQGHWNEYADIEGQMGAYYFDDSGAVGHFSYLGEDTWKLISNRTTEPYSPLELYVMGFIPPEEVPPIHILTNPDTTDPESITASSYKTVTIEEIIAAEGGERIPSVADSQKDFKMAFIVTQDTPYNDAAYAFFSLMSFQLTSKDPPPASNPYFGPFYWATGGRGTLDTCLDLDLRVPDLSGESSNKGCGIVPPPPTPVPTEPPPTEEPEPEPEVVEELEVVAEADPTVANEPASEEPVEPERAPGCSLFPFGLIIVPALVLRRRRTTPKA
jgi:hypothetical protein